MPSIIRRLFVLSACAIGHLHGAAYAVDLETIRAAYEQQRDAIKSLSIHFSTEHDPIPAEMRPAGIDLADEPWTKEYIWKEQDRRFYMEEIREKDDHKGVYLVYDGVYTFAIRKRVATQSLHVTIHDGPKPLDPGPVMPTHLMGRRFYNCDYGMADWLLPEFAHIVGMVESDARRLVHIQIKGVTNRKGIGTIFDVFVEPETPFTIWKIEHRGDPADPKVAKYIKQRNGKPPMQYRYVVAEAATQSVPGLNYDLTLPERVVFTDAVERRMTVHELELNPSLTWSKLKPDLVPGTWVSDHSNGEDKHQSYIVGGPSTIDRSIEKSIEAAKAELASKPIVDASPQAGWSIARIGFWVSVVLCALSLVGWLIARRRAARP